MANAFYHNVDIDPKTEKFIFEYRIGEEIGSFYMKKGHVFNVLNRHHKTMSRSTKIVDAAIDGWFHDAHIVFYYMEDDKIKQVSYKAWPSFYILAKTIRDPFSQRSNRDSAATN